MITKPVRFIQIAVNTDHIFGLTPEGDVYFRDKPPWNFGTLKKEDAEEKKVWKKCTMEARVEVPKGGAEREAQTAGDVSTAPAEVVVDEPPRKIYKDVETVKHVQTALKAKGFYNEANKIDGDLGHITLTSIKAFQKSLNLKETGEIDLGLWTALGLTHDDEVVADGGDETGLVVTAEKVLDDTVIEAPINVTIEHVENDDHGFYNA